VVTIAPVAAILALVTLVATIVVVSARRDKASRASVIHPQSTVIDAPILTANTLSIGYLTDHARIAPGNRAARLAHISTLAIHGIAVLVFLGMHHGSRADENQRQCS
jgi:hypothetical protein